MKLQRLLPLAALFLVACDAQTLSRLEQVLVTPSPTPTVATRSVPVAAVQESPTPSPYFDHDDVDEAQDYTREHNSDKEARHEHCKRHHRD